MLIFKGNRRQSVLRLKAGKKSESRSYPKKYEKSVPWALGAIAVVVVVLLVVIFLVIAGRFPGGG